MSGLALAAFLLAGCGGRAESDGRGAPAGAGAGSGNEGAGVSGAAEAGEAAVGAAGDSGAPVDTVDISGRWGLFTFEDPVGVELIQNHGVLSGTGCDVGAPPDKTGLAENLCGSIAGSAQGNRAQFDFHFGYTTDEYDYAADVTISADATRMTGRFHGTPGWLTSPLAWLRIPDGADWLSRTHGDEVTPGGDVYELQLQQSDGDEYSQQRTYSLHYVLGGLSGDLGSFFNTEMQRMSSAGLIVVGPVPVTDPALPVSLSIELDGKRFTQVSAITGTGHHYTFSATMATN